MVLGGLSSLAIILLGKRQLVALLWICCGCLCSVSLPCIAMAWFAICVCGFSWSYSLSVWHADCLIIHIVLFSSKLWHEISNDVAF